MSSASARLLKTAARRRAGDVKSPPRTTGIVTVIATVNVSAIATATTATESETTRSGARVHIVGTTTTRRMATVRRGTTAASGTRRTTVARRNVRRRGRRIVTMRTGPRGIIATTSVMIGDATGVGPGATTTITRLRTLPTTPRRTGRTGSGARLCTGKTLARNATARCTKTGRTMSVQRR